MPACAWLLVAVRAVAAAAALVLLAAPGGAQVYAPPVPPPPMIRVSGEARVSVPPDLAILQIGVLTQAKDAASAVAENAVRAEAALAALREALGPEAEVRTLGVTVQPDWRHPAEGGKPQIVGYTASNAVEARTPALDRVGPAIDAVAKAGANEVRSLAFTLQDEEKAQTRALQEAAGRARRKADAMAEALKLRTVRVLVAEEGGGAMPVDVRMRAQLAESDMAVATPVEPGLVEVRATVTLQVEIEPALEIAP